MSDGDLVVSNWTAIAHPSSESGVSGSPFTCGGGSGGASTSGAGGVYYGEGRRCLLDGMVQKGWVST